ncbi:hypothetical protein [Kribbella sp. ALI-6-A]|uniref:hypothetical protein n=1 Tax=Kribbella sp. ALI-6-A TaxID=1933817 RepID=UPI00117AB73B|nr:hypothetical protein [Kribbella sp. ALI-6-A]
MSDRQYNSVEEALVALTDDNVLERVAFHVFRKDHPYLRLTAPTGDTGRDLVARRLFSDQGELRVIVSLQTRWTTKLAEELKKIEKEDPAKREQKAIFLTTQSAPERYHHKFIDQAKRLGVSLEICGRSTLRVALETDELRHIAELELGVRPRLPRTFVGPAAFREQLAVSVPGIDDDMVGTATHVDEIVSFIIDDTPGAARLLLVLGAGGLGKTRSVVEATGRSATTTLLARAGASIDVAALAGVPVDAPVVIVVDDAHQSPDLSGIATLLGDPRYANVKIVVTLRPDGREPVLSGIGIGALPTRSVLVSELDRSDIVAIVRGHGIEDDAFTVAVIALSEGSPLLAHTACSVALRDHSFTAASARDVLSRHVTQRLMQLQTPAARATAVALALIGSAASGGEICALTGAVRHLPGAVQEVEELLDRLCDTGLVTATVQEHSQHTVRYSIKPDLLAPVLVAEALDLTQHVRIDRSTVLNRLGELSIGAAATGATAVDSAESRSAGSAIQSRRGVFGINELTSISDPSPHVDTTWLARALGVLSQACRIAGEQQFVRVIERGVYGLWPADADGDTWRALVALLEPVAGALPATLDRLRVEVARRWPPRPSLSLSWTEDDREVDEARFVLQALNDMTVRTAAVTEDIAGAIRLLMDLALLAAMNPGRGPDPVTGFAAVVAARQGDTWNDLFERRQRALRAIERWFKQQTGAAQPPRSPEPAEATERAHVAGVVVTATVPLLSPVLEIARWGTPSSADELSLSSSIMPARQPTARDLADAARLAASVLDTMDLGAEASRDVVNRVVRLQWEIWAIGKRSLPFDGGPVPGYHRRALAAAAKPVSAALAAHWDELPLWARHQTLAWHLRTTGRATLTTLANRGDPLATRAIADAALTHLMMLVPLEREDGSDVRGDEMAATVLANRLGIVESVELLFQAGLLGEQNWDGLPEVFAREVGRVTVAQSDIEWCLERLIGDPPGAGVRDLLLGLLDADTDRVTEWLLRIGASGQGARLAALVLDDVGDPVRRARLIEVIYEYVVIGDQGRRDSAKTAASVSPLPAERRTEALGRAARPFGALMSRLPGGRLLGRMVTTGARAVAARSGRMIRGAAALRPGGGVDRSSTEVGPDAAGEENYTLEHADLMERLQAGRALAMALARSRETTTEELDRVVELAAAGPIALVPEILQWVTFRDRRATRMAHGAADWVSLSSDQVLGLVTGLGRYLDAVAESENYSALHADHHLAMAVSFIARDQPEALASLLGPWLAEDNPINAWPIAWEHEFESMTPEERAPFAFALAAELDTIRATTELDERTRFSLDQCISILLAGTLGWADTVLGWAQGDSASKQRALAAVASEWQDPSWAPTVTALLAGGLGDREQGELLTGLMPMSIGDGFEKRIKKRIEAVHGLDISKPEVAAFRDRALTALEAVLEEENRDRRRRRRGYGN